MLWITEIAKNIIKKSKRHTIATGITPSGPFHMGHLREVITADVINQALKKLGAKTEFLYIADDFDPLRKLYPFLPKSYEKHIYKPLSNIPDPEGSCHKSYAEHFLSEFFWALKVLGIKPKVFYASQMYKQGRYAELITLSLRNKERLKEILSEGTGREMPKDWSPFNPLCKNCGKLNITRVEKEDLTNRRVFYSCECGNSGWADYSRGEGKLFWRIDWPARWKFLGVTIEPFGKEHAAAGGSFEVGEKILKAVFRGSPPFAIPYELIYLKGVRGKMSSSLGNVVSLKELLKTIPPEIVRYVLLRTKNSRHITFDPSSDLVQAVNEFNRLRELKQPEQKDRELFEFTISSISRIDEQIPFIHLATTVQAANYDIVEVKRILSRSGYQEAAKDEKSLKEQIERVKNWLENFAPEDLKFELQKKLPGAAKKMTPKQKQLLLNIAERLTKEQDPEKLHNFIYDTGKTLGLSPAQSFKPIYWVLLGKDSGPKAGWFLNMLDKKFLIKRFKEATK